MTKERNAICHKCGEFDFDNRPYDGFCLNKQTHISDPYRLWRCLSFRPKISEEVN